MAAGTQVSLIGRYAADPVYGGAGSGTVDPNDCINLYQGIAEAGLVINDTAYNWIASNFASYPKAAITMDNPATASYYIGEIPWADYSAEAQSSIQGTTALVVIGRGGGEGGDLSRDLKADVESGVSENFTPNAETANYAEGQHELQLTVEVAAGNYAGFDYDSAVVFPFGYGLSYTTFEQTLDSVAVEGDEVVATVTVTNTGSVAGKSVVEIYYSAPYTKGGIEKSAVVLGGFGKTQLLEPGASETVTVKYDVRDMASWSSADGCYVQDAGDYVISLRANSHDVLAEQTLALGAEKYATDSATGSAVTNRFDDMTAYMEANCENMSRADFAGTFPKPAEDKTAAECGITVAAYDEAAGRAAYEAEMGEQEMPTTGASNGLSLIDLRGADYDDEKWDALLDQLSVSDMMAMLNDDAYNTAEVASINKPKTTDPDGPAGFTSLTGSTGNCAYCSEYVMAQTFNTDLMRQMGLILGQEALASGYNGWYAPAMNTHRSPFAGRNFEYYSEDPVLAGNIAAAVVSGAAENGVYSYIKHFALNDQESYRIQHVCTWATEQVMRECYLKPFEICVKDATYEMKYLTEDGTTATKTMPATTAVMSSFNYVGAEWAGGKRSLQTGILRDEWGFQGFVLTDFNLYSYMQKQQALYGGTDAQLTYSAMTGNFPDTKSATAVSALREASHRLLYTVANSNAMNDMVPGSTIQYGVAPWQYMVWGSSAALVAIAALAGFMAYRRNKANKAA